MRGYRDSNDYYNVDPVSLAYKRTLDNIDSTSFSSRFPSVALLVYVIAEVWIVHKGVKLN